MEKTSIRVEHVRKSFGKQPVLRDVSFEASSGQLIGVVGENGSGKTTLLKILVGLLRPDGGTVTIRGNMGYCPQDVLLFETLTVRENFRYFASAYGLDRRAGDEEWLTAKSEFQHLLGFERYDPVAVSRLSGGTKQKLNFSLAVLHRPDILILDEPYSAFDWETYLRFWEFAEHCRTEGKTILLVSHFVYDRAKFDRVYELKEGVIR